MIFINHIEILGGDAAIVEINGPLNSETSHDFEEYVNRLVEKNIFFILLDAAKLEFISSDGIGLTLFIQKKLSKNNGFFIMYNLPDEVSSLFKLLGFDKIFTVAPTRIEAMQTMDRQIELRGSPEHQEKTGPLPGPDAEAPVEGAHDDPFDPFIVECINCRTLIRVKKNGEYICPSCKIEFAVDQDRSVRFL